MSDTNLHHEDTLSRISFLEKQYNIVANNTQTVSRLSGKMSLLITLVLGSLVIITGGVIYTFNGTNNFKDHYNEDKIVFQRQLMEGIDNVEESIKDGIRDLETSMDRRIDKIENRITILETRIKKHKDEDE